MASESSSAVLELKDEEDTDAETLADAPGEVTSAPLIMEHGYDIAVKVDAPMKQLSTLETFVTYRVRCVCARWPAPPAVRRRYNHFKELHSRLAASHLWLAPPPLPPLHSARQQLDRYSRGFVQTRALALHAFLASCRYLPTKSNTSTSPWRPPPSPRCTRRGSSSTDTRAASYRRERSHYTPS
ncbi:hypothetical protein JYU34_017971 [Plutella xylostella]|uniref:PX domain-containing protein n=1 Tax=Plutella xylostella TaxID=51655 RepID=A0ABQ7PZF0_PLUXY|nr:hypothetical protein JYU34_017971 [Plutella xylostella]